MRIFAVACMLLCGVLCGCPPRDASGTPAGRASSSPLSSRTSPPPRDALSKRQQALLAGARACVGYRYDAGYYAGGPPPPGKGACTDVVYFSLLRAGLNLQKALNADVRRAPRGYPSLRDDNIDYRWAPNLIVWFGRHAKRLPLDRDWVAGDVVFWSLTDDGVSDHCGIVSDRAAGGVPLVIHNFPPACVENDVLHAWRITGHFRAP